MGTPWRGTSRSRVSSGGGELREKRRRENSFVSDIKKSKKKKTFSSVFFRFPPGDKKRADYTISKLLLTASLSLSV